MNNFKIIESKINKIKGNTNFIKKAKKERINFYQKNIDQVNKLNIDILVNYNFTNEVLRYSEKLQKKTYIKKLLDRVIKLEIHSFAPELNKIHFQNEVVNVPQKKEISNALNYIIDNMSIEQLKEIIKNNKLINLKSK